MVKHKNCQDFWKADCPFLRRPVYQSGFTRKRGSETWWHCDRLKLPMRDVKKCGLAGNYDKQKNAWIDAKAKEARRG